MPHWRFVRGLAEHWHQVRAELSLVVPCEVGGTAEWAFSRPSLHWAFSLGMLACCLRQHFFHASILFIKIHNPP